jgi:tetratricopeptide (TPR) repeat protein
LSNYEKGWEVCQEGLKRLEGASESSGMARLLAEAGRTASFALKPADEVNSLCQRAIEMAERLGEQAAKAKADITIAMGTLDRDKALQLLQEAAAFSEANRLWSQILRAHLNINYVILQAFLNIETGYQHCIKTIDLSLRIGAIDSLFFGVNNLEGTLIEQGNLKTIENKLMDILRSSSAPQSRIDKFMERVRSELFTPRGEWSQALDFSNRMQGILREESNYQNIIQYIIAGANLYLELNRFRGMADFSEVETDLREFIETDFFAQSRFLLVVIFSRQKRFTEAHELLVEIVKNLEQPISNPSKVYMNNA